MISCITIENFKGIRERIELQLRPLTLLFGANSAGKSTIGQALLYIEEILTSKAVNPCCELPRSDWDFLSVAHNHDANCQIKIGVTCDVSGDDSGCFQLLGHDEPDEDEDWGEPTSFDPHLTDEVDNVTLELLIGGLLSHIDGGLISTAEVTGFKIRYNDQPFVEVNSLGRSKGRLQSFLWRVFLKNGVLSTDNLEAESIEFTCYNRSIFPTHSDPPLSAGFYRAEGEEQAIPSAAIAVHLNAFVLAAFNITRQRLRLRRTIGSIRLIPSASFVPSHEHKPKRWIDGSGGWDYIAYCGEDALIDVNSWLIRLGVGYVAIQRHLVDLRTAAERLNEWGDDPHLRLLGMANLRIEAPRRVLLAPAKSEQESSAAWIDPARCKVLLQPTEVGTGVSQLVPVVAAARSAEYGKSFNSIMQPELHLHPRVQAELGDLFIDSSRRFGHQFLIETHSEHLILRICRRIRETAAGKVDKDLTIGTNDVAVYFFRQEDGATKITHIPLDIRGEFVQPWPDDFFEIDFYERFS